jgi:hypothetical protein
MINLKRLKTGKKNDHLLLDLAQRYPAMVEGCKFSDILLHAEQEDYEELKNPEVLKLFVDYLKRTGKIEEIPV